MVPHTQFRRQQKECAAPYCNS